jgi:hypothetical protein
LNRYPFLAETRIQTPAWQSNVAGVLDFAVYGSLTTEEIPMEGDVATGLNNDCEPGHFKPALGQMFI